MKALINGFLTFLALATISPAFAGSELESGAIECFKSANFFAPNDTQGRRNYAPERDVKLLHLALDVTPDFTQRTVAGTAMLQLKTLLKPLKELRLDSVELNVHSVVSTANLRGYQVTEDQLVLTFAEPVAPDKELTVTIVYDAEPTEGIYFRTPEMGYKPGDTHLFSQGEEIEARHWYPCLDSPDEKFTSEITCRLPEGMTAVSNGRLLSEEKDQATGLKVFHWSQEKPHANYLISLVAGYFKKLEDKHRDVPLSFYTPPSESEHAATSFQDTKDIMAFFEQEIGVPYPWPKYSQACVNDFVAGGMENTSATTLTDGTLFTSASENIRSSDSLVSHEMAHQWFGDLVTCKDWSHTWLNEGFATYYESLYEGHKHGRDAMLYELYQRTRTITSVANDTNPIVRRNYNAPRDMFGFLAYPKGGWVLHMLRSQLGEELYRRCIKTYLERHRYGSVTTEDLRAVIEELSGRSYDQFFDQWLYHAHQPELEVTYSWDGSSKLAKISVRQTQKLSEAVLLFDLPLTVRFKGNFGSEDRPLHVWQADEDFYFPLESAPEIVRLDPEYTLLAAVNFRLSNPMLYAQLADKDDAIGRLLAIEKLAARTDKEAIAKLKQTLNHDGFYGARLEACRALRSIHSDDALEALQGSLDQSDARVRRQVVVDLGSFYRESVCGSASQIIEREKNPEILAAAIRNLSAYSRPQTHEVLVRFLNSDSFRNELADSAIGAIRSQDDPAYIPPLLEALAKRESDFTSRGFAQGLSTLAYLARNEEKKERVREFLSGYVNSKKRTVQAASLSALGTLGDTKAIGLLEPFANAPKDSRERAAAERALADLRVARRPVDDFKNLRQEVLDLQKSNRELRKELDDVKKRLDSRPAPAPEVTAKKKKEKVAAAQPKH